jgi:hypothetical protein
MRAAAGGLMNGFELVRICISGKGAPERIRWAAGMSVSLPEPLAPA